MIGRLAVSALSLLAALSLAPGRASAEDPCPQEPGQKVTLERGEELRTLGEYACAADHFERFAGASPRSDRTTYALGQAIALRVGLGDTASAVKDLDVIVRLLGTKPESSAVSLILDVAGALSDQARWPEVERFLSVRRSLVGTGTSTEQIQFQQMMARSLAKQGKRAAADAAYLRLAKVNPSSLAEARRLSFDDEVPLPGPRPAHAAVGEAKLHVADQLGERALKLTIKKGDAASLRAKQAAVAKAEEAYQEVFYGRFSPSTAAAAAGRLARIRSQLWAQTYLAMAASAAEAEEKLAIKANRACAEIEGQVRAADAGTRACGAWLERHRFQPFPALQELAPAPRQRGETAAEAGGWAWKHPL